MKFLSIPFLFTILITFLYSHTIYSQVRDTAGLNTIVTKVEDYGSKYPQEKVHLHFDKPYYAAGDTIWLKAYITAGAHIPSPLSKIVYIDVINSQDSLVQALKLPVKNSVAWGSIAITPADYRQGNYYIRAYTRWMMNFDHDYFFKKTIAIGSGENKVSTHITFSSNADKYSARVIYKSPSGLAHANKKITWVITAGDKQLKGKDMTDQNGILYVHIPSAQSLTLNKALLTTTIEVNEKLFTNTFPLRSAENKTDLQFFPEGGDLISGIPSKVAFKALKADGLGVDIKGSILDNENNIVADFTSQHLGMGTFILVPQTGKTYTAKITSPVNYNGIYTLPEVEESGITLAASHSPVSENISLRFVCNNEFFSANQNKTYYLMAKSGDAIYYAATITLKTQAFTASIPKDRFQSGIVQLTILSANGEPQCERLIFIRKQDDLALSLKTEKPLYGKRQKVKLQINTKSNKLPVEANVSVAVIDETKVPFDEDAETTILSNLLLTSDLKGYIEKPGYYFNRPNDKTAADLDVLMLTQGYRRFLYTSILADKPPVIHFLPEQGISITGTLRNSTGMPLNKANVKLTIPDKHYAAYAVTNGSGIFKFPDVMVTDSSEVIITSADYSNKNPMLTVDPPPVQPAFAGINAPDEQINIDSAMNKYLQNNQQVLKNSRVLQEVVIKGTPESNVPSHKDYGNLSSLGAWPDHLITRDKIGNCASFLNCMRSMLTGVTYENEKFYVSRDFNTGRKVPMQVFFNGMPVDATYLNSIISTDIESVEIFLKDQLGLINSTYQSNGALVINSKKIEKAKKMSIEEIRKLLPKSGEIKFKTQGYSVAREFYSPKYSTPSATIQGSDLRTTIYWDPKIKTDKATGNAVVEYYNADGRGTYKVVVEGIDSEGNIGRHIYRYKVE